MDLLKGIKIIDFTRLLPGPLATHLLAQMGAEVIKVESPKRPDYAREQPPRVDGSSYLFHQLNHNKKAVQIDYEGEKGRNEVFELIKGADVLIEQFRPGAMKSWGLGYDKIRKTNPSIIYASLTGYGQDGPLSAEAGHDINYLSRSGILSLLKDENGKPIVPGFQLADIGGGTYVAVMAIQAALIRKWRTGEGAYMDISMCDGVMPLLAFPWSLQSAGLDVGQFNVLDGKTIVNYAVYECADGKWLSVGALELKFWNRLCEVVGKPHWKRQHITEMSVKIFPQIEVTEFFKTKTRDEWMEYFFKNEEACVAPVLEIQELEHSDHHIYKNNFEEFKTENGKVLKTVRLPFSIKE